MAAMMGGVPRGPLLSALAEEEELVDAWRLYGPRRRDFESLRLDIQHVHRGTVHPTAVYRTGGIAVCKSMLNRTIYRVHVLPMGGVEVMKWAPSKSVSKQYSDADALPKWMQQKLAVLMVLDPALVNDDVVGVGRRISTNTFWVYPNYRRSRGTDTGAQSKELCTQGS